MNDTRMNAIQSLTAVMRDVQGVAKNDRNEQQRFMFRGIDAVMNAVGPALRKHGAVVVPHEVVEHRIDAAGQSRNGAQIVKAVLRVQFRWYGPDGSYIEGIAVGEANDMADKATSKAHSVALRTFLLQALCLPTDERDPDADHVEPTQTVAAHHAQGAQGQSADECRAELKVLLNTPPLWQWGANALRSNVGEDLNTTTNVAALQQLIAHTKNELAKRDKQS